MNKYPRSQTVIRFQDCDAFGHLNNAKFINYFIHAREDHLRDHYGFDLYEHARETGNNWFVTRHEIAYLRPAKLGEVVTIQTALIDVDASSLTVEGVMFDAAGTKVKAVQWTTFGYVDLARGRRAVHDTGMQALLDSIFVGPDSWKTDGLDARVLALRKPQPVTA